MGSFVKVERADTSEPHPLIYSLAWQILSRVAVGQHWGFEDRKTTPILIVQRISPDEFMVRVRGEGRELRLDLVNTARTVSDVLYRLHPNKTSKPQVP
jgi:hypothetical protein